MKYGGLKMQEFDVVFINSLDHRINGWYYTESSTNWREWLWNDKGNGPEVTDDKVNGPYDFEHEAVRANLGVIFRSVVWTLVGGAFGSMLSPFIEPSKFVLPGILCGWIVGVLLENHWRENPQESSESDAGPDSDVTQGDFPSAHPSALQGAGREEKP